MSTPHKHAEVIKAWADGKQIQAKGTHSSLCIWADCDEPRWYLDQEYRVKPETIRYRVALMRNTSGVFFTNTTETQVQAGRWETQKPFVRWLTDWVEVEV